VWSGQLGKLRRFRVALRADRSAVDGPDRLLGNARGEGVGVGEVEPSV
jgi:hypothetical protein